MQQLLSLFLCAMILLSFPLPSKAMLPVKQQAVHGAKKKKQHRYTHRRRSNTQRGRQQAMMFLQSYQDLAKLAGVPYHPQVDQVQMQQILAEDGEILEETAALEEELSAEDSTFRDPSEYTITAFYEQWNAFIAQFEDEDITEAGVEKKALMASILRWIGTPYHFGGTTSRGVDCSAFVQHVYAEAADVLLPRTARYQYLLGVPVKSKEELRFGDLVFFHTRRRVYVSHVGIYLGHGLFAHASSRYGVTISSLDSPYYRKRFIGGRRLRVDDIFRLQSVTAGRTQ